MASIAPYFIAVPLAAAFVVPLMGKRVKWWGGIVCVAATFLLGALSFAAGHFILAQKTLGARMGSPEAGAGIAVSIDSLSAFLLITINAVAFMVAVYSVDYVRKYTDRWKFHALFMLMVSGMNGILVSGDIFTMYVFLEIAALSGYFLVAFGIGMDELEAAFKYAVMGGLASIFILIGIAFLYSQTSTLNMAEMASVLAAKGPSQVILFVSALFIMGFGLKAALVPFHTWLPYAHSSAPAPISAMLSGISIKVLGIYCLARIFFNLFGLTPAVSCVLITLAVVSMLVGSILAFAQTDIKRLFAYSSISQIGYIALGLGVATPLSVFGALLHLFNHSVFKSLLFLNSGSIEDMSGTRDLGRICGVIARSPIPGYTSLVGALSICGMPPLGGFWSKIIIILACIRAGRPGLAFTAALVGVLTLAYYFNALGPVLFGKPGPEEAVRPKYPVTFAAAAPLVILAMISALSAFLLLPGPANTLLKDASSVLLGAVKW